MTILSQRWSGDPAGPPPGASLEPASEDAAAAAAGLEVREVLVPRLAVAWQGARGAVAGVWGSPRPIQAALYDAPAFRRAVLEEVERTAPDVVILTLSRLGSLEPALRGIPVVVDLIDALGANMRRRAERQPALGWLWEREARRLEVWEAELIERSALATVVAERDRLALEKARRPAKLAGGGRLEVVPFGLDVPGGLPARPEGSREKETVALTGNLGYFPTRDAARWFASGAWPALRAARPGCRWLIAGARPGPPMERLAREAGRGVTLIADPPSLHDLLARATVSIAPLFAGSGTPIKILEAMALGVPVVTTPRGAAGLDALPPGAVAVAEDAGDFARAVEALLASPERRRQQADLAFRWLRGRHHLPRVAERFEALLAATVGRTAGETAADAEGAGSP